MIALPIAVNGTRDCITLQAISNDICNRNICPVRSVSGQLWNGKLVKPTRVSCYMRAIDSQLDNLIGQLVVVMTT